MRITGSRAQRTGPRSSEPRRMTTKVAMLSAMLSAEAPERSHPSRGATKLDATAKMMASDEKIPASEDRRAAIDCALNQFAAERAPATPAVASASS